MSGRYPSKRANTCSLCASSMKNTGIFFAGGSGCFSLSFPRFSRASPFSRVFFSACFCREENIRTRHEGRPCDSFLESLAVGDSGSCFALDSATTSGEGWKFQ